MMRRASLILLLVAFLAGPVPAHAQDPGRDFGLAFGSVAANLLYTPPKLVTALFGLPIGGLTALLTGFDPRSMYAVWVPTVTGTYFLTPAHLEGTRPIEFLGSHYPSFMTEAPEPWPAGVHGTGVYPFGQP